MTGFHLVTDLDGTWLPGPGQQAEFQNLEARVLASPGAVLTFATGRTFQSALEAMDRWGLRAPRYLICDVGTALYHRDPEDAWVEDLAWADRVSRSWDASAAERLLAEGLPPGVQQQPGVRPTRRLALQMAAGQDPVETGAALREACRRSGLEADLLPSHGIYLDVLPRGVDKGTALAFLAATRGTPRPVVGCGDSENDLALLEASDHPVLVRDGLAEQDLPPSLSGRIHRTEVPGPRGILRALVGFGLIEEGEHDH